jgi:GAF domain-containing protein
MTDAEHLLRDEIARLQEDNRTLAHEITSLRRFIRSLQNLADASEGDVSTHIVDLLEQILRNALEAIEARNGSLLVLDEDTGELVFVLALGEVPPASLTGIRLPAGTGIAGWVAAHREPTIVEDARRDPRFYAGVDDAFQFNTKSLVAAPIVGGGRVIGVIEALNKEFGRSFSADDLALLMLLCRFAGELLHSLEEQFALRHGPEEIAATGAAASATG